MKNSADFKLVSFDIWGTLLKSNPLFVEARGILFGEALKHDDAIHLKEMKDEVDIELDAKAETTGADADFNERMGLLMEKIAKHPNDFHGNFFNDVREKLSGLFLTHLPELIDADTVAVFKELKKRNVRIALVSNTGFLHGDAMRPALSALGILDLVDCAIFSNEAGVAKPHPDIYKSLLAQTQCAPEEVLHVGDSVKADYTGAWKSNIPSVLFDPRNRHGNRMFSIRAIGDVVKIIDKELSVLHYENDSLFFLKSEGDAILTQDNTPFDLIAYSKFKYGDGTIAKTYGHALAEKFIRTHPHLFDSESEAQVIVTASPYKAIVKGSSGIVTGFKNYANQYLLDKGRSPMFETAILKKEMFEGDYGLFTDKERKELMNKNDLYVMERLVKDKTLILIDDARITGSHESNLVSFIKKIGIRDAYFLYIADMALEFAMQHPNIENVMNHGWIDGLDKLADIMMSPGFILNARVCKYILSKHDQKQLKSFLEKLNDHVLYTLYNGIIGDGYASMDSYKPSFEILKETLETRHILKNGNFITEI